ncbi:MAG TPA: GMP/IMP nucleotidase [Nevskiaceae bacterium]|nr:GMP/IMP nucleotidase [Nevskiaceae bacterium]
MNAPPPSVDWSRVDTVLLDMDGTILDLAYDNFFWRTLVPERYAVLKGLSVAEARAALEPHFTGLAHTLPWYCTDHWSALTGLNMAALKQETRERVRPLAGAVDFLHAVRASGRALWLATNAHRDSWTIKLAHTGLTALFDLIVCSHDFGAPKESADFWSRLQARHPFEPARALFADDSLPVLRAAQAYGIGQVLGIRCPDTSQPCRELPQVTSVGALRELLPLVG